MPYYYIPLVLVAGILAGFMNIVAGGGSMLTIPLLIFLGLPPAVANGTNRIAIVAENLIAVANFKRKGLFNWKLSLVLGIPALVGSIIGSNIAIDMEGEIFNKILGVSMILALAFIIWQPQNKVKNSNGNLTINNPIIGAIVFFFIGVYGGLIQVGIGFIIIFSLLLIGKMNLAGINSIKSSVVAIYMVASLSVFIINGKVDWLLGLILAIGNGIGAYIGSNFSVNKGDKWIRIVLVITVLIMSLKLIGIF